MLFFYKLFKILAPFSFFLFHHIRFYPISVAHVLLTTHFDYHLSLYSTHLDCPHFVYSNSFLHYLDCISIHIPFTAQLDYSQSSIYTSRFSTNRSPTFVYPHPSTNYILLFLPKKVFLQSFYYTSQFNTADCPE